MKKKRNIIIVIASILLVVVVAVVLFIILNDKNKLTVDERKWINANISKVQNINVVNNANVFGKDGKGVFYSFLNDFSKEYDLKVNPITYNKNNTPAGITFGVKSNVTDNDIVFYKDHFVLISKNKVIISEMNELLDKKIGILNKDHEVITKYISNKTFTEFETREKLLEELGKSVDYVIVPLMEYMDTILVNNYNVIYHFSDIIDYYVAQVNDDALSNVIKKYFNKWQKNFNSYFNDFELKLFTTSLNITEKELDELQSVAYNYGFVNTSPYEVIIGGEYGGIVAVYLKHFSEFSKVEFNFVKYKNYNKFTSAIEKGNIDVYFNYYNFVDIYQATEGPVISYTVAAKRGNPKVIKSINSLKGETVYVQKDSKIYDYVKTMSDIKINTFTSTKELNKLNKEDVYLVLDENTFDYMSDYKLDNYTKRYTSPIPDKYEFKVKENNALFKLLDKYTATSDTELMKTLGLENHYDTVKTGSIMSRIAEYIIYLVLIAIIILLLVVRKSKKITIAKKIKKDDKLKFIDQLTSLKNRNFLNENISVWNNNTIYPQTIVVVDLNRVQEINDQYGYNEGDRQIKSTANVLIKTQLDNSEVLRTDGNEFVIYLVGYSQKQISNYIHKLNKEISKLPYSYGAEFGYSMIVDDIKTIEDAMNEAVEEMKKQKASDCSEKHKKEV
ncbi:MAG: GGDEF domain-containing protein [Bacilli bacterium]